MCTLLGIILILTIVESFQNSDAAAAAATGFQADRTSISSAVVAKLDSHKFQLSFLNELHRQINDAAAKYIDNYLKELQKNSKFAAEYQQQFEDILNNYNHENIHNHHHYSKNKALDEKTVFLKQMLDVKHTFVDVTGEDSDEEAEENFYILKNTIFLKHLRQHMDELQEQSEQQLRQFKINQLCLQFQEEKTAAPKSEQQAPIHAASNNNLAPLAEQQSNSNTSDNITAKPRPPFVSLQHFGAAVYERIKAAGSEIIDDYLNTVRKLLIEVIDEQPDNVRHSEKLNKVLHEIDAVLQIEDFAQKRERLYNYLQTNLALDYELFKTSEHSQRDLAEIMLKLKRRGMDMFFNFLVSNFEFLEHLHKQWAKVIDSMQDDNSEDLQQLREVNKLYNIFKEDSEHPKKFDAYMKSVSDLYERVQLLPDDKNFKIYEILNNASQNVGTVTLNMIKSKCDVA